MSNAHYAATQNNIGGECGTKKNIPTTCEFHFG